MSPIATRLMMWGDSVFFLRASMIPQRDGRLGCMVLSPISRRGSSAKLNSRGDNGFPALPIPLLLPSAIRFSRSGHVASARTPYGYREARPSPGGRPLCARSRSIAGTPTTRRSDDGWRGASLISPAYFASAGGRCPIHVAAAPYPPPELLRLESLGKGFKCAYRISRVEECEKSSASRPEGQH